jgi:hypothetical protein
VAEHPCEDGSDANDAPAAVVPVESATVAAVPSGREAGAQAQLKQRVDDLEPSDAIVSTNVVGDGCGEGNLAPTSVGLNLLPALLVFLGVIAFWAGGVGGRLERAVFGLQRGGRESVVGYFSYSPCVGAPCDNGGDCVALPVPVSTGYYLLDASEPDPLLQPSDVYTDTSFQCRCTAGWVGHTCAEDVDECSSSPCQNGGSCADSSMDLSIAAAQFWCNCRAGWEGDDCSVDTNECARLPCPPGSLCTDSIVDLTIAPGSHSCSCEKKWQDCDGVFICGDRCAAPDPCVVRPCHNGGVCLYLPDVVVEQQHGQQAPQHEAQDGGSILSIDTSAAANAFTSTAALQGRRLCECVEGNLCTALRCPVYYMHSCTWMTRKLRYSDDGYLPR